MLSVLGNLRHFPLAVFNSYGFSDSELQVFEKHVKVVSLKKKEKLLLAGEVETNFRFLHKGLIRQYYVNEGEQVSVHFMQKEDVVCSFASYASEEPSSFFLEALEDSTLLCFSKSDMEKIVLSGLVYHRFVHSVIGNCYQQKDIREINLLANSAMERLQQFYDAQPYLFMKLPQIYIASYLNIQPETLSTLKRKLNYNGVVKQTA